MQHSGGHSSSSGGGNSSQAVKTILVGEDHQPQLVMMMEGGSGGNGGGGQLIQHFQLPTSSMDGRGEVAVVIPATTAVALRAGGAQSQPIFVNTIPSLSGASSSVATISRPEPSAAAPSSSNLIVISDQNHRNSEASGKLQSQFEN